LIFAAFSTLQRSREGIQRVSDRYREGRLAMARVCHELESAYLSKHLPINLNLAVTKTLFKAQPGAPADRIDFTAFVNRRMDRDSPESDQAEVSYFGMENPNQAGVTDLIRRINPHIDLYPDKGGRGQVLANDIDLFDLRFMDPLLGQWVDEWDTTQALGKQDRLPYQVKVTLVLNGGGRVSEDSTQSTVAFEGKISLPMMNPLIFALQ
jgi:general secretion pathway protein J